MDLKTREGRREQGELIKTATATAGLTLKDLASRMGVSHALIYQYVSGANLAQPDKLQEIAHLTGNPISFFFGEAIHRTSSAGTGAAASPPEPPSNPIPASPVPNPGHPALAEPAVTTTHAFESPPHTPLPAGHAVSVDRVQQSIRQLDLLARAQERSSRDLDGLLRTLDQMLSLVRVTGDPLAETELLLRIGNARTDAGDLKGAAQALEECISLSRENRRPARALSAAQSLARCQSLGGQTREAEALFRQVAASDDLDLQWRGLLGLGQILEQQDRYDEALAHFSHAGSVLESLPAEMNGTRQFAELYLRTNIANVYMSEGDFAAASRLWMENLDAAEQISQPDQFLEALISEGVCSIHSGRPGAAASHLQRAVRLCRLLGDRERLGVAKAQLADVLCAAGLAQRALEEASEAAQIAIAIGSSRAISFSHLVMARSLALNGQIESAEMQLETEIRASNPKVRVAALILRSELRRRRGNLQGSAADAALAIADVEGTGALHLQQGAWVSLALASAADTAAQAVQNAEELANRSPGLPDTPWQLEWARGRICEHQRDVQAAAVCYGSAVKLIQELRADLGAHGIVEACLDDAEKQQIYLTAVQLARSVGQNALADGILIEAAWPPLNDRSHLPPEQRSS